MRRHRGSRPLTIAVIALALVGAIGGGVAWWLSHRGPTRPSIGGRRSVPIFLDVHRRRRDAAAGPGGVRLRGHRRRAPLVHGHEPVAEGSLPGTEPPAPGGCSTSAIEYNSFHKQTWTWCAADGRLVERGNTTDQKFDFGPLSQSEHTEVVCNPPTTFYDPATKPGHKTPVRCKGRSETTKANINQRGRITFVRRTTIVVGGTRVPRCASRRT